MSTGVTRLKGLAVGLGDEISAQNDQLERIGPKVERADTKIRDQNRQMRHILGKQEYDAAVDATFSVECDSGIVCEYIPFCVKYYRIVSEIHTSTLYNNTSESPSYSTIV